MFEIRFLKEISIIRKKNVFLCLPLSVRMSSKQNTGTEQDILLWNIMKMKFVFSHFTFPSAYLGPHFIIVTVAWNCVTALTMALGVNILLHFTLVIGLSFSFLLQKQEKICIFSLCPHFYFIRLFKNNLEWPWLKLLYVVILIFWIRSFSTLQKVLWNKFFLTVFHTLIYQYALFSPCFEPK